MDDVEQKLGLAPENSVKAVAVARRGAAPVICGIGPEARLDLKRVASALGVTRSSLGLLSASSVTAEIGMDAGAVGLVPPTPVKALLERRFESSKVLYFGSGDHGKTIRADRRSLLAAFDIAYAEMEMKR